GFPSLFHVKKTAGGVHPPPFLRGTAGGKKKRKKKRGHLCAHVYPVRLRRNQRGRFPLPISCRKNDGEDEPSPFAARQGFPSHFVSKKRGGGFILPVCCEARQEEIRTEKKWAHLCAHVYPVRSRRNQRGGFPLPISCRKRRWGGCTLP